MTDPRRALPSVSALLEMEGVRALLEYAARPTVVEAARRALDLARRDVQEGASRATHPADWVAAVEAALTELSRPSLRPVVNATGVVLHTNLGRAPLADAALGAIQRVARGFSNLELDLERGVRGSRYVHCAALLRELTGADDAIVVNNCAAALVLALDTFASAGGGREVIVSRGELVEIGGSFRIPDIMAKSGARLVEVGTTNRTHLSDYEEAVSANTAAIVKVHRSNFALSGFVSDVPVADLAAFAAPRGIPVLHDLGSGLLISLEAFGLSGEPTAREALRAGASLVTMSGDKLLGGPQAGLMVGQGSLIAGLRKNPLARSYRVDKLTLAALEATLSLYRDPARACHEIPTLVMLTVRVDALRARAARLLEMLPSPVTKRVRVVDSEASVGGGAFPTVRIPSVALELDGDATDLERRLRLADSLTPVVGHIVDGRVLLDLRTILPFEEQDLVTTVAAALG